MEERHRIHGRFWDRMWPALAVIGPLIGFVTAKVMGVGEFIQRANTDHEQIANLVTWKGNQEDFNKVIIAQIAELRGSGKHGRGG